MAASATCPLICLPSLLSPAPPISYVGCLEGCIALVDVVLLDPPGKEIPFEDLTEPRPDSLDQNSQQPSEASRVSPDC